MRSDPSQPTTEGSRDRKRRLLSTQNPIDYRLAFRSSRISTCVSSRQNTNSGPIRNALSGHIANRWCHRLVLLLHIHTNHHLILFVRRRMVTVRKTNSLCVSLSTVGLQWTSISEYFHHQPSGMYDNDNFSFSLLFQKLVGYELWFTVVDLSNLLLRVYTRVWISNCLSFDDSLLMDEGLRVNVTINVEWCWW